MLISGGPISSAPISARFNPDGLPVILADVAVNLAPFTLTANTLVRGNLATASLSWDAFTLSSELDWGRRLTLSANLDAFTLEAFTELETELTASLTWDAFTLDALAEQETEAEVTAIWQAFTLQADAEYKFRFVRLQNISGTIIRPLGGLPSTIITAGSITRDTQVISLK